MVAETSRAPVGRFGSWQDAEALRRWSFARRSPQQRLEWLIEALTLRYLAADAKAAALKLLKNR